TSDSMLHTYFATLKVQNMNGLGTVSRRVFIQVSIGTGAGLLLTACGSAAQPVSAPTPAAAPTSPPTSAPAAAAQAQPTATVAAAPVPAPTVVGAAASGKNSSALPSYIAPNLAARPDFDAHDPRVTLAWNNYPMNPPTPWNKAAPGTG